MRLLKKTTTHNSKREILCADKPPMHKFHQRYDQMVKPVDTSSVVDTGKEEQPAILLDWTK